MFFLRGFRRVNILYYDGGGGSFCIKTNTFVSFK